MAKPRTIRAALPAAFAAGALVLVANRSGVGWSWDSADYVSSARSLSSGLGVLDAAGRPTTIRPPGYPAFVAIGELVRLPTRASLLLVNLFSAVVVVLGVHALLAPLTRASTTRLATWFVAITPALLWQYSMAWSEPVFVALLVSGLLLARRSFTPSKYPLLAAACTALFYVRYAGLVFVPVLLALALVTDLPRIGRWRTLMAGLATPGLIALPVYAWLSRNRSIDGFWTGPREAGGGTISDSVGVALGTLGRLLAASPDDTATPATWSGHPLVARAAIVSLVVLTLLAAIVVVRDRRPDRSWSLLTAACLFAVVGYVGFSAYRFVNLEYAALDTRMMVPVLPLVVVSVALVADRLVDAAPRVRIPLGLAVVALLAFHATVAAGDARRFSSGRHLASAAFRDAPLHQRVRELPDLGGLYSNAPPYVLAATGAWPVFDPWRMNDPRPVACSRRFVVWYRDFPLQDNVPDMAPVVYEDATGTIYDVGPCDADVKLIWD